ncbi:MAG: tRNA (N6-threonylcarbamoyladenosine(37)-N6)-methyltransferase TrmO [Methanobacteriaceae archaeon]|nr:tRNA (N6-threonylcarbamoyladenosine(37)-N6)-methyltransferase TrmO [Methanobacteriaceae archaeon]
MNLEPIGIIHSPYQERGDAPRQGRNSENLCKIEIFSEFVEGLDGIERYENLIILYWLDRSSEKLLKVIPPGQTRERGVFATRAPTRPNPIAFCMVDLLEVNNNILIVRGLDALDKSPLVDIKPHIPDLDCKR